MWPELQPCGGFHPLERDGLGQFVWTQGLFRLSRVRAARFARLALCYNGDGGVLSVRSHDDLIDRVPLTRGWQVCAVNLGDDLTSAATEFRVTPIVNVPGDHRELGVMLREAELFDDDQEYQRLRGVHHNGWLNQVEFLQGAAQLASTPPALRINLETRCNIPETSQACVYCAWDWAKLAERGSPNFAEQTLAELGDFYAHAWQVNDCSIGEPSMHKEFGAVAARLDADGKLFSLTTNGQLLSPRRRREIVGRNMDLYVSIDAASAAGFARYRNDRFDDVIANLRALCCEKKQHGNLPRVYATFIAMRSNVTELPRYFELMRAVGVDKIKLRALYLDDNVAPVVHNNGYRFDYAAEVLDAQELEAVRQQARRLAAENDLAVHVEWEQFPVEAAGDGTPRCSEPWRTLYVLRRGIMPCCFATEPIARWHEQGARTLAEFVSDVFNGPEFREIRSALAAGRLADYCRRTPSCPIVKEAHAKGEIVGFLSEMQSRAASTRALPLVPLEALAPARDAA
ncbi:MAG: radical SAM/SPASM domain-containing protein [Pirellulales bacterium]